MDDELFESLHAEGLLSASSLERVRAYSRSAPVPLHMELRTILYLGVLLLSTGLGVLVYKNIDTIGHQTVLALIALLCAGCFVYCVRHKLPFSPLRVAAPGPLFDYILLLGCLTFITLIGYAQAQFGLFGQRFGLMLFIPMVVLFFCAYYFDHLGVLSMAITNLAAWCGIAITPERLIRANDFSSERIVLTGILLGALLLVAAYASKRSHVKEHFEFTYTNFGAHLLFVCALGAMFSFERLWFAWFLVLAAVVALFYRKALRERSFYYMLILTLYGYVGISYAVMKLMLLSNPEDGVIYLGFLYFIGSATGLVLFLIAMNKKIKAL